MRNKKRGIQDDFPFETKFSLSNIIGFWELRAQEKGALSDPIAKDILAKVNAIPELREPIEDRKIIEKNINTIQWLMSAVLPSAMIHDQLVAVVPPFKMDFVYTTKSFDNLMLEIGGIENMLAAVGKEEMSHKKTMAAYHSIMEQYYGVTVPIGTTLIFPVRNQQTGLMRYFKVTITTRFCQVSLKGELPDLSEKDIRFLLSNSNNVELWAKYLPADRFLFLGFALYSMIDITQEQVTSLLKESLLKKDSLIDKDNLNHVEDHVKSLVGLSDVNVGLASFEKNRDRFIDLATHTSYQLDVNDSSENCPFKEVYEFFSQRKETLILEDLEKNKFFGGFEDMLIKEGYRSLLMAPLFYGNRFLGLLKLSSPKAGDLNSFTYNKLSEILPLFSLALKQNADEVENKVQALIKESYTSIHPTVEWKFLKAANNMLVQMETEDMVEPEPIVFKDVLPLYGASDIRGSSTERNKSIQADLTEQLDLSIHVLGKASEFKPMHALDELTFRLEKYRKRLKSGLSSGDEVEVLEFLHTFIEPLIKNIASSCPEFAKIASGYWKALDPDLGVVYKRRRQFEESLTMINDKLSAFIENEQIKAQKIYPHYFEKYVTDGVEYNIYMGDSLTEGSNYDPIFLNNMRLWQIITMVEVARKAERLKPNLPIELDTTHLILVHNTPLSIRFRLEEKKFDVDGAYNIRYEIIKKRIDKALIKNTDERLTQPGKIAIVYSNDRDADEYMRYIEYLQAKKFLTKEVEKVMLEDLQGVSGLKALRITVRDDKAVDPKALENISIEALN